MEKKLTKKQEQIVRLVALGKTNKEIALELGLSVATVGVHKNNIMKKLGTHKSVILCLYAIKTGLVNIDVWELK